MQKILTRREKNVFYLTIAVVVSSVVFNFIVNPVLQKNANLNKKIEMTRAKINKYSRLVEQKEYYQNKYKLSADSYISGEDSVNILSEIEAIAKDAGVHIIDIRPQNAVESKREFLIDIRIEGSLGGIIKFIYGAENSLMILNIRSFRISTKSTTQNLEATFTISKLTAKN